ncbi:MAG: quinoprotein relay system zinc metallohydrolase 2 [Hyphomicrobium sp.]|nr:quinoprotein relay system zinc metallohydrolase 2 [Hyphomicrobium sp.]
MPMCVAIARKTWPAFCFPQVVLVILFSAALGAQAITAPYDVREIAPGVFVHEGRYELFTPRNFGNVSNTGFIVGRDGVAVIDTGGSPRVGADLLKAIRAKTDLPITFVINTHMHPDHVFGNAAFVDEKPTFVGHRKLPRALAARARRYLKANEELLGKEAFDGTQIIAPTLLVGDKLKVDLGDRVLILEAHKTAHTDNDVTVYDKQTGTLFLGDLLFAKHVPALDGSIRGWLALLDQLSQRKDVARVVPGHGPASVDWPDAFAAEKRYLARIADDVRTFIEQGRTLAQTAKEAGLSEKDAWLLFDAYHARNVSAAYAELEWE